MHLDGVEYHFWPLAYWGGPKVGFDGTEKKIEITMFMKSHIKGGS